MTDERQDPKQESGSQQPKQPQSSHQQDQNPGQGSQQQTSKRDPKNLDPQKGQRESSEGVSGVSGDQDKQFDPSKGRKAS
jgi:hypothetical protein